MRPHVISANDMHVITTQFLTAAQEIHVAMCLFDDDHAAQAHLNRAMHSALIGAEQCRQLHAERVEKAERRELFPIMSIGYRYAEDVKAIRNHGGIAVVAIPWALIKPHEKQAQRNHSQSLERLAERGGLSPGEAVAVLGNRSWRSMDPGEANAELLQRVLDAEADARVEAMRERAEATAAWKLKQWAAEGHPMDDRMIEAVKSAIASLPTKGSPT